MAQLQGRNPNSSQAVSEAQSQPVGTDAQTVTGLIGLVDRLVGSITGKSQPEPALDKFVPKNDSPSGVPDQTVPVEKSVSEEKTGVFDSTQEDSQALLQGLSARIAALESSTTPASAPSPVEDEKPAVSSEILQQLNQVQSALEQLQRKQNQATFPAPPAPVESEVVPESKRTEFMNIASRDPRKAAKYFKEHGSAILLEDPNMFSF